MQNMGGGKMGRLDKEAIGDRMLLIMQCLWEAGRDETVAEITEQLNKKCGMNLSRSGIYSMLRMLVEKGYLEELPKKPREQFYFRTLISEEEYRMREIKRLNSSAFRGSASALFATFIKSGISQEELNEIKEILNKNNG